MVFCKNTILYGLFVDANLVVHAECEKTDDGYTYVNLRISANGIEQEHSQFLELSLKKIIELIFRTRIQLGEYREKRNEIILNR